MVDEAHTQGWRSACGEAGSCVEVCYDGDDVLVRSSRDPSGPVLTFTTDEWRNFCAGIVSGELLPK
ncbi:DUF397 domain-containing protein [Catelliglobosispora koreensis]|uniref:DUF397 domain-containing protein n=1 Tax=Catelliglobosispora koreensis TaxID=129052 RepID=UPI00039DF8CB|nr:DUF397 domain-containing protein [Catelliglobosispora koreensis]